jgi:hypothetical protein
MAVKQKTYIGFDDLPVYNFYQIIEYSDVRWFYKTFYKGSELKISETQEKMLSDRFQDIFSERLEYSNDLKSLEFYRKYTELRSLEVKFYRIVNSFNVILDIYFDDISFGLFVNDFAKEGFIYDKQIRNENDRIKYILWLQKKIKGVKNKLNITRIRNADVLENKDVSQVISKFDLVKEKILLQEALGISINERKCSLKEWVALCMRAEEKARQHNREIERMKAKRIR